MTRLKYFSLISIQFNNTAEAFLSLNCLFVFKMILECSVYRDVAIR